MSESLIWWHVWLSAIAVTVLLAGLLLAMLPRLLARRRGAHPRRDTKLD